MLQHDVAQAANAVERPVSRSPKAGGLRVRRIQVSEANVLRDVRLRALADAPDAFEITLEQEQAAPPDHWTQWARRGAAGKMSVTFVAVQAGQACGMAGSFLRRDASGLVAVLFGMWVDPQWRGRGFGRRLVRAVVCWARARGAARIELWVVKGNTPARSLYLRTGFGSTGQVQAVPSRHPLEEELLTRTLRSSVDAAAKARG